MKETFEEILIPGAVYNEILRGREFASPEFPVIEEAVKDGWVKIVQLKRAKLGDSQVVNLGVGEKEAIALVLRQQRSSEKNWLIMDDELASKTARSFGLNVRAVSYLPIYWTKEGIVKSAEAVELLDNLVKEGYRLSPRDYVAIKELILVGVE